MHIAYNIQGAREEKKEIKKIIYISFVVCKENRNEIYILIFINSNMLLSLTKKIEKIFIFELKKKKKSKQKLPLVNNFFF